MGSDAVAWGATAVALLGAVLTWAGTRKGRVETTVDLLAENRLLSAERAAGELAANERADHLELRVAALSTELADCNLKHAMAEVQAVHDRDRILRLEGQVRELLERP